jgi:hypothetical protein
VPGVTGDFPEAFGPIISAPGKDPHGFVCQMDLDAVAVKLDFVNPAGAARHLLDRGGQGRLDEARQRRLDANRRRFSTLKCH